MLKSYKTPRDITSDFVPRRRVRRLKAAVGKYKRVAAASTALMAAMSLLLFGFILTDGPDTVSLGTGRAGVMDTLTSDTKGRDAANVAPPGAEDLSGENVAGDLPTGEASFYGNELSGHPTASGENFDPDDLTAAHRTLPFGTRLRVTNIRNGKSVVVRVNDRGPFSGNRVLDLSKSAARQVGMLRSGTARVRMQVLQ